MGSYFKMGSVQFLVMVVYLSLTSYEFVQMREPNPIGVGIQQWLLFFAQLFITAGIFFIVWLWGKNKTGLRRKFYFNILLIISLFVIFLIVDAKFISDWLWHLRGGRL